MRTDLIHAATQAGVTARFHLRGPHRHESIFCQILESFTVLGPRGIPRTWWWEHLKGASVSVNVEDGVATLQQLLPADLPVWLVVEDFPSTGNQKSKGYHWLIETDADAAMRVLKELPYIEYYLVDRKFAWLLCEDHHGVLHGSGAMAIGWLQQISQAPSIR